ncbi:putative 3-demethylubiquinone-9 3-methyltransferase (glyoxalase superfamily) [Glaciihabitans tibetensis]|uniref:Putative 3-demethylubiquinone-9 3-methyltransferase (Glyoxalase superfamily) n=1 Tax=Glaciihabitans tibetensis TaxID=1266600 RepID=A0A2T0VEE5_9MICO|nr:VOC family protein [Glaciihabitans tibetensis]PRY68566.1 putative 3-demethylubiquinone-9 3-methyltransferase (glyoxalase superfamily) [Glaciihabitans tibetensis]
MPTITPYLWFDTQAEEAAEFYVSVFDDAKILDISRYGEGGPVPAGTALTVTFQIGDQRFSALNGGPAFSFTEAVSFLVDAPTQPEIDELWNKLTADGGAPSQCGWLKDKFGLSWQIVPPILGQLLSDPDPARAGRVMQAMLQMTKLDIAQLQAAADAG